MKVTYPVIFTTYKKMNNGLELKSKNGKKIKITKLWEWKLPPTDVQIN